MNDINTLEELVTVKAAESFVRLNNLFQLEDGRWQANLMGVGRRAGEAGGFAYGTTPTDAVRRAFDLLPPLPAAEPKRAVPRVVSDFAAAVEAIVDAEPVDLFG